MKNINTTIRRMVVTVIILTSLHASTFGQQSAKRELRLTPREIKAFKTPDAHAPGSSNLSAVQVTVIYGDPSKEGLYTILLKVAPNTKIPAHLHPDERVGTVISGTWHFGYGDKFTASSLKKLPPGSVYTEDKNINHFAMTGKEPVIVALTGYGPSGVTYVNPADDPGVRH